MRPALQVNCDGEAKQAKHYKFGVLPKRLRVHMPKAQLLKDVPDEGTKARQAAVPLPFLPPPRAQLTKLRLSANLQAHTQLARPTQAWRAPAQGSQQYTRKVQDPKRRPQRKQTPVWQHPVVRVLAKNGAILGLGVIITIGLQRWQRHRQYHNSSSRD